MHLLRHLLIVGTILTVTISCQRPGDGGVVTAAPIEAAKPGVPDAVTVPETPRGPDSYYDGFSKVGGDCAASFDVYALEAWPSGGLESSMPLKIASDYCSGFGNLYIGNRGKVVELNAEGKRVEKLVVGWEGQFSDKRGTRAILKLDEQVHQATASTDSDTGCAVRYFKARLDFEAVSYAKSSVSVIVGGGCP